MAELKPCPFCGKHATGTIGRASEMLWDEDDGGPYPHQDSFSVLCSAAKPDGPGGCGASGGYFPTEAEAIAAWNRRAPTGAVQAGAVPDGKIIAWYTLTGDMMFSEESPGDEWLPLQDAVAPSPAPVAVAGQGEAVKKFRALLRAEVEASIDPNQDIARQEAFIDEADHLLVKFNELFPE